MRVMLCEHGLSFFFFKQKTAYEMRISDWSSDVCSSDLPPALKLALEQLTIKEPPDSFSAAAEERAISKVDRTLMRNSSSNAACRSAEIGRASCRERVCQYV